MVENNKFSSVFDLFEDSSNKVPEGSFLCTPPMRGRAYYPKGFEITYSVAHKIVMELRSAYYNSGYGPGHRVALLLENRPEFHLHWLALNGLGISVVPINPDYREDEIIYLLDHSESLLVISISERISDLRLAVEKCKLSVQLVEVSELEDQLRDTTVAKSSENPGIDSEAALLYTSGTTGRPKGCILTNRYFLNAGKWYLEAGGYMTMTYGQERLLNPLPLYHANAMAIGSMAMISSGGCIVMVDRFHPKSWWGDVVASKATIIHYLGIMPPLLLNQQPGPNDNLHNIKFGAGAGIDPKHHQLFEERFGFPLIEGWGMTEVAMPTWGSREPRQIDTRAFGRPLSGCEVRIVDNEEMPVPSDTPGELTLRMTGNNPRHRLFSGYLKDDTATEIAWRGGWFHTGDTVTQSADGVLTFVDRTKNIIRRSGENIAAAEIEAILQSHDYVAQAAVIAVADELRQEEVMACIILMEAISPDLTTATKLQEYCLGEMAYYKAPAFFLFVDTLPVTNTQKVSKVRIFPPEVDPRNVDGCLDLRERKRRN